MTAADEYRDPAGVSVVDAAGGRRYCLTRYDDVAAAFKDARFGAAPASPTYLRLLRWTGLGSVADACESGFLVAINPPDHKRLRKIIEPAFRAAAIDRLTLRAKDIVDQLLQPIQTAKRFDLIADFAAPLPTLVIAEMIGFPPADLAQLKQWSGDLAPLIDSDLQRSNLTRRLTAFLGLRRRIKDLVKQRLQQPREDLLTTLAQAQEVTRELSEAELVGVVIFVLTAGHATTTHLIGTGILSLLDHLQQSDCLRDEPGLIDKAIEEMLRFNSPIQRTGRVLLEPIELHGQRIPHKAKIRLMIGAANRDPRRFENPDQFDIFRSRNAHVGFGAGIHQCLGLQLARMEARIAIGSLVEKFPRLARVDAPTRWVQGTKFRGLTELAVTT
jgi:pimeloyl-[acyl-carrier protein] synthase